MKTHGGTITSGLHNTFLDKGFSTFDSIKGGVKTLINEFVKMQASLLAEWLSEEGGITYSNKETGETLSPAQARLLHVADQPFAKQMTLPTLLSQHFITPEVQRKPLVNWAWKRPKNATI